MKPIPFDPLHDAAILNACGYVCTHNPAYWQEIGDIENGPRMYGHDAFDEWRNEHHSIIVVDEEIVEMESCEPLFDDSEFYPELQPMEGQFHD